MKRLILPFIIFATVAIASADPGSGGSSSEREPAVTQQFDGMLSITSKGKDVRDVITDVFMQAKKNFVLDKAAKQELYLILNKVEFDEALSIICKVSNLEYEVQNGIYYISKVETKGVTNSGNTQPTLTPKKPEGRLPATVLTKKVTVKYQKTDFRDVIREIGKLADVNIEIDPGLNGRMVDAQLSQTTLKEALDMLGQALQLEYKFTDNLSLYVYRPNPNKITVIDR